MRRKSRRHRRHSYLPNPTQTSTLIYALGGVGIAGLLGLGYYYVTKKPAATTGGAGGGTTGGATGGGTTPPPAEKPPWPGCVPSAIALPGSPPGWNCPPRGNLLSAKALTVLNTNPYANYVPYART